MLSPFEEPVLSDEDLYIGSLIVFNGELTSLGEELYANEVYIQDEDGNWCKLKRIEKDCEDLSESEKSEKSNSIFQKDLNKSGEINYEE